MLMLSNVLFVLVALLHVWFFVLESLLWEKPLGLKTFGQTRAEAAATAVLAKNQGVYNLFLAAGLAASFTSVNHWISMRLFFGAFVVVAAVVGAVTTRRKSILVLQGAPAALAIALAFAAR